MDEIIRFLMIQFDMFIKQIDNFGNVLMKPMIKVVNRF